MSLVYLVQSFSIIYISYLAGGLLGDYFSLFTTCSPIRKFIYATGIGVGILSNIGLCLIFLKLYTPISFIVIAFSILLISRRRVFDHAHKARRFLVTNPKYIFSLIKATYAKQSTIKIVVTIWVLFYFGISLLPSAINPSDALYYHLPFAMEFAKNEGVGFPLLNESAYGHLPVLVEAFYGIPITLFQNFVSFKIIQFAVFIFLLLLLLDFAEKYIRNKVFVGALAILLLANMPLVKSALEGGMIDIFTTFFGFAALVATIETTNEATSSPLARKAFVTASIFLGLALSTKYIGLFFFVICWMLMLFFFLKNRIPLKKILTDAGVYLLITLVVCGFWYIKNIVYTGNPFFPMFSEHVAGFTDAVNAFVLERTFANFILFPFFLFGKDGLLLPYALITAATFVSMYALFIFLFLKKKLRAIDILLFVFIETYLFILFLTSHQVRFAIPALVGASLLLILTLDRAVEIAHQERFFASRFKLLASGVIGATAVFLLVASLWSTTLKKHSLCLLGLRSSDTCFAETAGPNIFITNYINNNLKDETVMEYDNIFYFFHLKNGNHYSSLWCAGENRDKQKIGECLRAHKISYLVDNRKDRGNEITNDINHRKDKVRINEYFREYGVVIFEFFDQNTQRTLRLYKLQ